MKKLLLSIAAFALVATTMTSCKKDYKCECSVTTNGTSQTYNYDLKDVKKKDAKDACNSVGNVWIMMGGKCDLK